MKKIATALLILTLCVSLAACGGKKDDAASTTDAPVVTTTPEITDAPANGITPDVAETSVGGQHWAAFVAEKTANPDITAEELASKLVNLEINGFSGMATPMEAGSYLPGFDNFEATGFETCVNFMPMIGSIAYVGYIFELSEDADVAAFIKTLEENCNPRWNICVSADQTVIGSIDHTVFFLMCPETYPTNDGMGDMGGMGLAE